MARSNLIPLIEAARSLPEHKHPHTLRRAVVRGDLRAYREPRTEKILIDPADLRAWYDATYAPAGVVEPKSELADSLVDALCELVGVAK